MHCDAMLCYQVLRRVGKMGENGPKQSGVGCRTFMRPVGGREGDMKGVDSGKD